MRLLLKHTATVLGFIFLVFMLITWVIYFAGGRINTSKSIPVGLYWITQQTLNKGEFVLFCPPQWPVFQEALRRGYINTGFCPGETSYLMKRVSATKGDIISINTHGVWVNHQLLPYSKPHVQDAYGRPLPELHLSDYVLKPDEFLLMTNQSELSFDSRYFGIINKNQIKAVIRPIVIWSLTD